MLLKDIQAYCLKSKVSTDLTETIIQAIHDWLHNTLVLQRKKTPTSMHPLIVAQSRIGWEAFLKGFLSQQWSRILTFELKHLGTQQKTKLKPRKFLITLLQIFWKNMTTLWKNHLQTIHQSNTSTQSPDKIQELKSKIRQFHHHKEAVLAARRDQYFHQKLEEYLQTATISQMRMYILNYSPAIYASIKSARLNQQSNRILQFPGFTRHLSTRRPIRDSSTTNGSEEPIHHKHHRWRLSLEERERFRNYFHHQHPNT